jgi:hypothetical protein
VDEWEGKIHAFVSTNIPAARTAAHASTGRWRAGRPLSLPLGLQVLGFSERDADLFSVAAAFQSAAT